MTIPAWLDDLVEQWGILDEPDWSESDRKRFKLQILSKMEQDVTKVDRLEVIDGTGRAYVKGSIYGSPVSIELSYQDDGRTLKVFVTELTAKKRSEDGTTE